MLMDVITSPRGSARCGKEWSCRAESIFALKGINLKIVHSEAVHCYMGYFETYILPVIFFMYGRIMSLTFSHLYHYLHFPTMVGFCLGGNVLGNHDGDDDDEDTETEGNLYAVDDGQMQSSKLSNVFVLLSMVDLKNDYGQWV